MISPLRALLLWVLLRLPNLLLEKHVVQVRLLQLLQLALVRLQQDFSSRYKILSDSPKLVQVLGVVPALRSAVLPPRLDLFLVPGPKRHEGAWVVVVGLRLKPLQQGLPVLESLLPPVLVNFDDDFFGEIQELRDSRLRHFHAVLEAFQTLHELGVASDLFKNVDHPLKLVEAKMAGFGRNELEI